ncbi:MAG: 16S rRNA processing protein RimM [Halanaerobiaceae bacterium]|jgi:16S rRNA processing protein RimM|nr:16S rRNA processing protein RimM [Halanaerobiaceae bacterium]
MSEKMITIGKITKSQGNKGEVRVLPLTDFPERFEILDKVFLVKTNRKIEKEIESLRFHKGFVIIKFTDINDINSAEEIRDFEIRIPEEEILPLKENEYYINQLIGFEVMTVEGKLLGNVSDILITGGVDVLVVNGEEKEYMIPAALELITEVNEREKRITVKPIPGLLEL